MALHFLFRKMTNVNKPFAMMHRSIDTLREFVQSRSPLYHFNRMTTLLAPTLATLHARKRRQEYEQAESLRKARVASNEADAELQYKLDFAARVERGHCRDTECQRINRLPWRARYSARAKVKESWRQMDRLAAQRKEERQSDDGKPVEEGRWVGNIWTGWTWQER